MASIMATPRLSDSRSPITTPAVAPGERILDELPVSRVSTTVMVPVATDSADYN